MSKVHVNLYEMVQELFFNELELCNHLAQRCCAGDYRCYLIVRMCAKLVKPEWSNCKNLEVLHSYSLKMANSRSKPDLDEFEEYMYLKELIQYLEELYPCFSDSLEAKYAA